MEMTEDLQDRIDRYLLDRMEPGERNRFEALLDRDAQLRQELAVQQNLAGLIEKAGDHKLKKQLDGVYAEVIGKEQGRAGAFRLGITRTAWAVAASVVLLVALLLVLWGSREGNPGRLFAQYYRPEPYLVTRSQGEDAGAGGRYFNDGQYGAALEAFRDKLRQNPGSDYDLLYLGLSYLELGQYDRAGEVFERVAGRSELLGERAAWYRALTYLKSGKVEESKTVLRKLAENPSQDPYAQSARQLLSDLE